MTTELKIYDNPQFGEIRTAISESGEPLFCLADVCRALDINNPRDVKSRLSSKGMTTLNLNNLNAAENLAVSELDNTVVNTDGIIKQRPGNPSATFITEANLYRCIFQSRKPEAEAFQDWVTEEVLPSIRKTGSYSALVPQSFSDALFLAAKQQKQLEAQQILIEDQNRQIAELADKASYLDIITATPDAVNISQIAKDYGFSGQAFNKLLKEHGIIWKCGGQWVLTAKYAGRKYTKSITETYEGKHGTHSVMRTK